MKILLPVLLMFHIQGVLAATRCNSTKLPEPPADVASMVSNQYYFSDKNFLLSKWTDPREKELLNLYSGFQVPVNGKTDPETIEIYFSKVSVVIDRAPSEIDPERLLNLPTMQKVNAGLATVTAIQPGDLEVTKRSLFSYRNRPNQPWCTAPGSICFSSHYELSNDDNKLLGLVLTARSAADLVKSTLGLSPAQAEPQSKELNSQSEARILNKQEIAALPELKDLTGANTAVTGVVQQNVFWINHAVEYGKVAGVIQPFPGDPDKTLLTGFSVYAIEGKWWGLKVMGIKFENIAYGCSWVNGKAGLSQGFPKTTLGVFQSLVSSL